MPMPRDYYEWNVYRAELRQADADKEQTTILRTIRDQNQLAVRNWAQASDAIVLSQERRDEVLRGELSDLTSGVLGGLDDISGGLDSISRGIAGLGAMVHAGMGEILARLECQGATVQAALQALRQPLATQAMELRFRAEKFYRDELYEDALQDFLESESKNRADFDVLRTIGNIHFYGLTGAIDFTKAAEYYRKAAKYSKSDAPGFAGECCLWASLADAERKEWEAAYVAVTEGLRYSPDVPELLYRQAVYALQTGRMEEGIAGLRKVITCHDPRYAMKATAEPTLQPFRSPVLEMIAGVRVAFTAILSEYVSAVTRIVEDFAKSLQPGALNGPLLVKRSISLSSIEEDLRRGGFIDIAQAMSTVFQTVHERHRNLMLATLDPLVQERDARETVFTDALLDLQQKSTAAEGRPAAPKPRLSNRIEDYNAFARLGALLGLFGGFILTYWQHVRPSLKLGYLPCGIAILGALVGYCGVIVAATLVALCKFAIKRGAWMSSEADRKEAIEREQAEITGRIEALTERRSTFLRTDGQAMDQRISAIRSCKQQLENIGAWPQIWSIVSRWRGHAIAPSGLDPR